MTTKICVNCKHYKFEVITDIYSMPDLVKYLHLNPISYTKIACTRNFKLNLVTGEKDSDDSKILFCKAEREDALRLEKFRCGVDAKFYEPKTFKI